AFNTIFQLMALMVMIFGCFIAKQLLKLVRKSLERSKVNKKLRPFIISYVSIVIKILLVIIIADLQAVQDWLYVKKTIINHEQKRKFKVCLIYENNFGRNR
ncbi:MAG: hypothetical protein KDD04_11060, partial [Sinomicrobium sp.]|nr:hypothetical protein [Sinomicrobium sp.]